MEKKKINIALWEEEGMDLKERIKRMDITHPLYPFVKKCIEKFDKKIEMMPHLYTPEEMPHHLCAIMKIEYDESLKELLLSKEAKVLLGDDFYRQLVYRFTGIYHTDTPAYREYIPLFP